MSSTGKSGQNLSLSLSLSRSLSALPAEHMLAYVINNINNIQDKKNQRKESEWQLPVEQLIIQLIICIINQLIINQPIAGTARIASRTIHHAKPKLWILSAIMDSKRTVGIQRLLNGLLGCLYFSITTNLLMSMRERERERAGWESHWEREPVWKRGFNFRIAFSLSAHTFISAPCRWAHLSLSALPVEYCHQLRELSLSLSLALTLSLAQKSLTYECNKKLLLKNGAKNLRHSVWLYAFAYLWWLRERELAVREPVMYLLEDEREWERN